MIHFGKREKELTLLNHYFSELPNKKINREMQIRKFASLGEKYFLGENDTSSSNFRVNYPKEEVDPSKKEDR